MEKPQVIIIDDDITTLIMLDGFLVRMGLNVQSAQDGAEGFDLICKVKPRLVFCDILIPKIDGLQLCRKVRECAPVAETIIVLMSAVFKDLRSQSLIDGSGADYFIDKPLEGEKICSLVERILAGEGAGPALSSIDDANHPLISVKP